MKYYSKRYLEEKWNALKRDMEILLDNDGDSIPEEKVNRVKREMIHYMDSIIVEIGK